MHAEVFTLFQKYRDLLDQEINSRAVQEWVDLQCARIARRIVRRGYGVFESRLAENYGESVIEGEEETACPIQSFELCLVPLPPKASTPIKMARATMRLFFSPDPSGNSLEALFARTESEKLAAERASAPIWDRVWTTSYEEECAFLASFKRHWTEISRRCSRNESEVVLPDREIVLGMIRGRRVEPGGLDDIYVFSALVDKELEYLSAAGTEAELGECGCKVSEHLQALEDWEMRNLL